MKITAKIENSFENNYVIVQTDDKAQQLRIHQKSNGYGSSVNGGEFLLLALAACFCNDIYREAEKKKIIISKVIVEASGEFAAEGEPGYNMAYSAKLEGNAPQEELIKLIKHTDKVAEIQNTLRAGVNVRLIE